jgi:type I site-specific restriction endonuclease
MPVGPYGVRIGPPNPTQAKYKGSSRQMRGLEYVRPDPGYTAGSIKATQTFLKNQGYAIPVDGKMGPLTKSALADWHKGKGSRNPDRWTSKLLGVRDTQHDNHGVTTNNQRNQPARSPSNNLKAQNQRVNQRPAGRNISTSNDGLLSNESDPDVFASSLVEAEYGPILAELQREEQRIRQSGPARLGEIDRIYSDLSNRISERTASNRGVNERLQASTTGAAASLASALGLGAADPSVLATLGASTGIERDFLRDTAAADERFGADLGVAAEAEEAAQKSMVGTDIEEALSSISSTRREAQGSRAADLIKYKMDYEQMQAQNKSQALKDKLAMFSAEMAASMAPLERQKMLQDLLRGNADIAYTQAQTAAAGRSNRPKPPTPAEPARRNFQQLAPDERLMLQDSILNRVAGVKGGVNKKVALINSMLRGAGYNPISNRYAKQFAFDTAKAAGIKASKKWWGGGR